MSASMDDYVVDMTDVLGRGSYGQVYRGRKRTSGSPIAVKRSNFKNGGIPRTTVREICLLKMLSDDPHFVRLLHAEKDKDADVMNIVMEYVDGNLEEEIDGKKRLITIPEMKDLMYQLCKGLAVSHSRGIMHRDLKPANLLLNKNRKLKIADLGSSRKINFPTKDYTPSVGTIWYKAPEILLKASTYTMAVDMWSAGCIFAELAEEEIFFETLTPDIKDQIRKIFRRLGPPDENTWPVISSQPEADMREYDDPYEKISFKSHFPRLDKDGRNLLKGLLLTISTTLSVTPPFYGVLVSRKTNQHLLVILVRLVLSH